MPGLLVAQVLLFAPSARADSVADFYRGKTINVYIGVNVGGGYDFEARLIARFMKSHIPGNPTLVSQNMIGAGGIKMANYLYSIAAQDGTAIGMFPKTLISVQAVGTEGVAYDANRFSWIGSMTTSPDTFAVWHTTGVRTIEDARRKELTAAASNKGAITYSFPRMLNEFLGTRLKIVSGYQGNSTMVVAMERREVDGVTNSWDSWKSLNPAWIKDRKINILVQTEPKSKEFDAPSVQELARNDDDRQVIDLIVSGGALGKPMATAPNVPPERVAALRAAFDATVRDPEFIKAAAAARIDIDLISAERLQETVRKVLATPRYLTERAKAIMVE
ncbi:MAG TPA: tripartite tricarboxylate transporter substrate-binding protein [Xanthobacteraceae bacterium]|jgi:tripartite-type tricarboxylate transporter receptor subunit TctC